MKITNKLFNYKNKIILFNGSSIQINSSKFLLNYYENLNFFLKKKTIKKVNKDTTKSKFFKKIFKKI